MGSTFIVHREGCFFSLPPSPEYYPYTTFFAPCREKGSETIRAEKDRKIAEKIRMQSTKHDTSAEYLSRFFQAASPRSVEMGKAHLILEDAVKKAEHILLEKKCAQMAANIEDQAEVLAEEIFLTPGSLLMK